MLETIRNYIAYRKNRRTAKRELVKIAAAALPAVREFTEQKRDVLNFLYKLTDSAKNLEGEALLHMVIKTAADRFGTGQERLLNTLQYIARLSPQDIQKLLIHAAVKTADTGSEALDQ